MSTTLADQLATMIERHRLEDCSTEQMKAELARRGEALPQQVDLREPLAKLYERADALNDNLNSGDYNDAVRERMEEALAFAERALIADAHDAAVRQAKTGGKTTATRSEE